MQLILPIHLSKRKDQLDKAAKEIDKGNVDKAQKHYDDALELLAAGMDLRAY